MNISGNWEYKEDFEYGISEGEVELIQNGNHVEGSFSFIEIVENDYRIQVVEKVKGTILDGKVILKSTEVIATQNGRKITYLPNTFEVHLVSEQKLVGSTFDSEEVCGVFVMEKKKF